MNIRRSSAFLCIPSGSLDAAERERRADARAATPTSARQSRDKTLKPRVGSADSVFQHPQAIIDCGNPQRDRFSFSLAASGPTR
jgi:hypothetical protein